MQADASGRRAPLRGRPGVIPASGIASELEPVVGDVEQNHGKADHFSVDILDPGVESDHLSAAEAGHAHADTDINPVVGSKRPRANARPARARQ